MSCGSLITVASKTEIVYMLFVLAGEVLSGSILHKSISFEKEKLKEVELSESDEK